MRVKKKYLSFFSLALLHKSKCNKIVILFNKSVYSFDSLNAYDLSYKNAKTFSFILNLENFKKQKIVFRMYKIFLTIVNNLNLKVCCFINL